MDMPTLEAPAKEGDAAGGETIKAVFLRSLCGYNLSRSASRMTADFMRALDGTSMRPVLVSILSVVEENTGIHQGEIGQVLGIARANMAPLVNELEAKKLLVRKPDPADRRAFVIELTHKGHALLDDCKSRIRVHEEKMLASLSDSERKTLINILGKIKK